MTDTARLISAVVGSLLLHLVVKSARSGRFDTVQGSLLRSKSPRVFRSLLVFWAAAAVFLFAAAVGAFSYLGGHQP